MATLQHYIHYKLHNKPMMLRSVKEGSKGGRRVGREGQRVDFIHVFSLIQTNVESYLLCGG